jgi:hypothetical protein
VRPDHVARLVVNANHSIVSAAAKLCIVGCVWLSVPQATEWKHIGKLDRRRAFLWKQWAPSQDDGFRDVPRFAGAGRFGVRGHIRVR